MTKLHPIYESFFAGTLIMLAVLTFGIYGGYELNWIECLAVYTSFICTYLCVLQSRWNYVIGVVTTAIYSIVFYNAGLIGSMILNIYLVPTLMYGWFIWGRDEVTKPVEHVKIKNIPWYVLATVVTYLGAWGIVTFFGGEMANLDAAILIGTILAQYLLDRKKIETWVVWVFVNIVSIYVYWNAGLPFVTIQYIFFLGNTVYGAFMWHSTMNKKG